MKCIFNKSDWTKIVFNVRIHWELIKLSTKPDLHKGKCELNNSERKVSHYALLKSTI